MRQFAAIYLYQVNQYLSQPLHLHQTHDSIAQEILDNQTQISAYVMFTDDFILNLQEIMRANDLIKLKNDIIFVHISSDLNQNESPEFTIKVYEQHQNASFFNCHLSQNMKFLPAHKIIDNIKQLLSDRQAQFLRNECSGKQMKFETLADGTTIVRDKGQQGGNLRNTSASTSNDPYLQSNNILQEKSSVKKFCNGITLNKDAAINIVNFAISNIQTAQKFEINPLQHTKSLLDAQQNLCHSPISTGLKPLSNYKIANELSARKTNLQCDENIVKSYKPENYSLPSYGNKKIHYLNIFDKNHQTIFNYQAQATETFEGNIYQQITPPQYQDLSKCSELSNQQEHDMHNIPKVSDLIIVQSEENTGNLQIENFECVQTIQLSKTRFNEMLQFLLNGVKKNDRPEFLDTKKLQTPEGIICIKLSLIDEEINSVNSDKLISLLNLLKNYFNYFTYVYSEDSHQVQQEIIKSFQSKLKIGGQISINSGEKVSKIYNPNNGQHICTFPKDNKSWSDHFEINKNHVFYIYGNANKVNISVDEELLEYQSIFEALHKIYEDKLILRIFDMQDKISEGEKLMCNTTDFVLHPNSQLFFKNDCCTRLFSLASNADSAFVGQVVTGVSQLKDETIQHIRAFSLKMYSFFGVNTPHCFLSYQPLCLDPKAEPQNDKTGLKLCIMTEYLKKCKSLSKSFLSYYKCNKNHYYYYPSTVDDGPLIGFGSALTAAYLLNDANFFGDNFENVCFVKKNGYFEFTKLATSNIFPVHSIGKNNSSPIKDVNVTLISNGGEKITFEDLCEYDKFEFKLQILKLKESDRFADKLWDQFISLQCGEQFKLLENEWTSRIQKIANQFFDEN